LRAFYLVLPTILVTPFVVTGLFFHQAHMVALKGWTLALSSAFLGYAASSVVGTLAAGPLVDRFGARRVVSLLLMPLALGLAALTASAHPIAAYVFMLGAGATTGMGVTLISALWAEMYGARHIRSIRSLAWTAVVVSTAAAPAIFGALFDAGVTVEAIAAACLMGAIAAAFLAGPVRLLLTRASPPTG
jgi:MFS family permease